MNIDEYKLDNPVWFSLSETHKDFAIEYGDIKFYHPDYCPFGGFINGENTTKAITEYSKLTSSFYSIGQKPIVPNELQLKGELICHQMIIYDPIISKFEDTIIPLGETQLENLLELVQIVYPEYFKKKTYTLGNYYGIYKNDTLVAVTGERMQMDGYIEVSAVITHPDHLGKGYAKQLVAHTVNTILSQNKIPFLHVAESNTGAIQLYEKLGFKTRKKISVWNIVKNV